MSPPGVFSTLGDIMSTPGTYHDECGGYHEYTWGCSVQFLGLVSVMVLMITMFVDEMKLRHPSCLCQES